MNEVSLHYVISTRLPVNHEIDRLRSG